MNFSKRISISLLFALSIALFASAAPRTKAAIKAAAARVFSTSSLLKHAPTQRGSLKMLQSNNAYTIMGYDGGGFVIVSNDDLLPAVIAYSNTPFDNHSKNDNFKWYLSVAEASINELVKAGKPKKMIAPDQSKYAAQIPAFVTSHWGQEKPFNDLCPEGTASGTGGWQGYGGTGKCVTGCVATAMAQIMYYNGYPKRGIGKHSVTVKQADGSKKKVTVNYEESEYDWANMIDNYDGQYTAEQGNAVARLMLDCGVAADMSYATDASGSYTYNACEGLKRNFGYPETTQMLERKYYSEDAWMDIIYNELNARRAIFYSGQDLGHGGHAFVLSGYDTDGKVWINWGWEGNFDGFYDIALLNPQTYKFSADQDMIIGFEGTHGEQLKDTITVREPGKLATLIRDSTYHRITKLKVKGKINSTDLQVIRRIAGRGQDGKSQRSMLQELDLTEAEIVEGGEPYLIDGVRRLTTTKHEVPERAFYGCSGLHKLYLPETTTAIADGALGGLVRLDSVSIPAGQDKTYVFDGQLLMTKDSSEIISVLPYASGDLSVKKGIKKIHQYGLSGCVGLTKVTLPASLVEIGHEAFAGCNAISIIRSYAKTVPELGRNVFDDLNKSAIKLQVPTGTKSRYQGSEQWRDFNVVEFGTTIKVRGAIRKYGEENPKFGWQVKGDYVSGTPEVTCEATPTSPVGKYTIHINRGSIVEEQVEFIDGILYVQKATANLHAKDLTIKAGETPTFAYTIDGLQNNETTLELTEAPTFTVNKDDGSVVTVFDTPGVYTINISGGLSENYLFNYMPAHLTIQSATDGIAGVKIDSDTFDIYTSAGRLIVKAATNFNGLAKGIYIVNGKKVAVK